MLTAVVFMPFAPLGGLGTEVGDVGAPTLTKENLRLQTS